jgi:tetratricopeptide (TPR) repeat protein
MKYLRLILILLGLLGSLYASEFEKLKMAEERGTENPDLYYNLGVTYWQTGHSGMATLYFLKALNLDSAHRLARENLEYAINLSQDRELYPQRLFLVKVFLSAYNFMNLNRMAVLCLVFLVLSALSLLWYVNYDPDKERGLPGLLLGITLTLLFTLVFFTAVKAYRRSNNKQAVLIESEAELREEADSTARRSAKIHEGIILQIRKRDADWSLVNLPDGRSGWILNQYIGMVN